MDNVSQAYDEKNSDKKGNETNNPIHTHTNKVAQNTYFPVKRSSEEPDLVC